MLFKDTFFMRVLLCKIQCPHFICFCKPSPHIFTPGSLNLENSPNCVSIPDVSDQLSDESQTIEVKEGDTVDVNQQCEIILKSNLKMVSLENVSEKTVENKRVQWMDNIGKELLEIKEFEASEVEDSDNEGDSRSCVCIIL